MSQPLSSQCCYVLYVNDLNASVELYNQLFASQPFEQSPFFAMYRTQAGSMIGLWQLDKVKPALSSIKQGSELVFSAANQEALAQQFQAWQKLGLSVLQDITEMDFGHTFVFQDMNGHRLRVMWEATS